MDVDDHVAQFTSITSADPSRAAQYLRVSDNNLEQAIQLYFESGGIDMGAEIPSSDSRGVTDTTTQQAQDPITIDSDDEEGGAALPTRQQPSHVAPSGHAVEDDEAMARRLQEEMYGSGGGGGGGANGRDDVDEEGVRAPIGRQAETLSGPYADWRDDPDSMENAIAQQMMARQMRQTTGRPGIFNQAPPTSATSASIWEDPSADPSTRQRDLSRATAGASDSSSKSTMLAELFRPPFELISKLRSWEAVRAEGKEDEKWILINVQDPNIFDCQILNRDIWKDPQIRDTVKEHFIFKQYTKDDPQAHNYIRYYFQSVDSSDAYPHIAIVDPRTGEQVKVWSGMPAPKAPEFLHQLHEFLDRYSLKAFSKNPVARRKAKENNQKDVGKMTEDEMLQAAMQASLQGKTEGPKGDDPDQLTRSATLSPSKDEAGPAPQDDDDDVQTHTTNGSSVTQSPFAQISSTSPHTEPAPSDPNTTRIQFRHPGGRVVRRFNLSDPVTRLYEWLKSDPAALGKETDVEFELIFVGKNLIDAAFNGETIESAGLKNGSVMVELVQ
ncbi:MAG: hypothetical protein M1828_000049 [Chrysothrix sp. TS-e1954]|nr:MAG: hypothetical protein M1828_000049 [Chrysothrix sp. TS-e1954]